VEKAGQIGIGGETTYSITLFWRDEPVGEECNGAKRLMFEFLEEFAAAAQKLAEEAHHYSAAPFDYGAEIDTLRRLARTVAEHPYDTAAGGKLLGLVASIQRFHDTAPIGEEYKRREHEMRELVKVLQEGLSEKDQAGLTDIVRNVASETPFTKQAAQRLKELLPKLGKSSYDLAVKVISDVASATAKKWLGL
jgi:hypothetical protein